MVFLNLPAKSPKGRKGDKNNKGHLYDQNTLRGVEWVHGLFLFPLVLGKM